MEGIVLRVLGGEMEVVQLLQVTVGWSEASGKHWWGKGGMQGCSGCRGISEVIGGGVTVMNLSFG